MNVLVTGAKGMIGSQLVKGLIDNGYKVVGPNGKSIFLPAAGYRSCDGDVNFVGYYGYYWSYTPSGSDKVWDLDFYSGEVRMDDSRRCYGYSVCLVKNK